MKIALVGYARSGKDTVCQIIQEYLENNGHGNTLRLAFGDELRERFHETFPEVPRDPKPREGYEKFGQLGRDLNINIWVKSLDMHMRGWQGYGTENFVITDLRQLNEARWARKNDFIFIHVWAYPVDRKERSESDSSFQEINHSERFLHKIKCDHTIYNIGTLEFLRNQVIEILEQELKR